MSNSETSPQTRRLIGCLTEEERRGCAMLATTPEAYALSAAEIASRDQPLRTRDEAIENFIVRRSEAKQVLAGIPEKYRTILSITEGSDPIKIADRWTKMCAHAHEGGR